MKKMSNSKDTVLYLGGFELPDKNAAAHRVVNNSRAIKQLGFNVVLCGVTKDKYATQTSQNYFSNELESRLVYHDSSIRSLFNFYFRSKNYLSIIKEYTNTKIIILYNYPSYQMLKTINYCRKNGIKVIGDVTEWYDTGYFNPIKRIIKGIDVFIRMRFLQKKLDGLICISDYLYKYYTKSKVESIVVPPLVNIRESKWKIPINKHNVCTFIYAGSLGFKKDSIFPILNSLSHIKDDLMFNVVIIGYEKGNFIKINKKMRIIIDELGEKIIFKGRLTHEDTIKEIKKAHYSFFIRDKTRMNMAGFPTKFVESISAGTKVITNSFSDLDGYFKSYDLGYIIESLELNDLQLVLKTAIINYKYFPLDNTTSQIFHYQNYVRNMDYLITHILD